MNKSPNDNVTLGVTGVAWMGDGTGSVQALIEAAVQDAKDQIQVAAYLITEGDSDFLSMLRSALLRGVQVTVVVDRLERQSSFCKKSLLQLAAEFPFFKCLSFDPENRLEVLHAKILLVDRRIAIIGSSNFTWKGMVSNHELAVKIEGTTAERASRLFDKLAEDRRNKLVK